MEEPEKTPFIQMTDIEQMNCIKMLCRRGTRDGGETKGNIAKYLRSMRPEMKLAGLFNIDKQFMNIELRDFLNVNEDGKDCYTWNEIKYGNGWREIPSIGSQYHQSTTELIKNSNGKYVMLNAKFVNTDGREAIFRYPGPHKRDGVYINEWPDKGTYNYVNAVPDYLGHGIYDVYPFMKNPPNGYNKAKEVYNPGDNGNSHYWRHRFP